MAKKMNDTTANFRLKASAWAVASSLALAAFPLASEAAGLGKITVFSALGQPLRAEMEVFATREELSGMKAQLASQEAFKQAGVEYAPALSGVTLSLDKRPNGQPIIRLTSTRPINEPFVDLLLELNWPTGRLIREYTFLLDPPEFAAKAAAVAPAIVRPLAEARPPVETRALEERSRSAPSRLRTGEPAQLPADGTTYEVKRGETLSRIASDLRPEGVSLDQMLLGLFQANQNAFDGGDINRLKAGKILSIPDKATLEAIPRGEAKTIIAQSSNWEAYRRRLATVAADAPGREEGARQAAGRITTRVEDRAGLAAEPKDQLKVSKTDLPGTKPLSASKRTDEDLIAKEKALKDANERLASLERNVAELQRLVELKSQNLADLERQSAAKAVPAAEVKKAETATPSAPLPTPVAAPPAPAARVEPASAATPALPAKPMESPVEVKPAETVAKPEVVTPMPEAAKAEVPPVAAPPKPVEVPKARPVPPPPEEPGFIEWLLNSTAFLAAGGALIALLAAYWLAKRRRAGDGGMPPDDSSTLAPVQNSVVPKSVFHTTGGQTVDTTHSAPQTDFSQAGPGSIDTDEVDPVAEADVYMAYGRDAQAEEILLEAKQKDPRRYAIHLKLLEIYAGRKDPGPFGVLATELFNATGGVGADWEKAVAMGLQLDPGNPLFGAAGQTEVRPADPATAVFVAQETFQNTLTKPELSQAMAAAAGVIAGREEAALADEAQEVRPEPVALADLDFDLGHNEPRVATPDVADDAYLEATLAYPNPAKGDTLDFDLAASLPNAQLPPEEDMHEVQLVDDASSLEVTMLVASESQPGAGLDFEFDLGADLSEEATADERTLAQAQPEQILDIGSAGTEALEFDIALTDSTVLGDAMQRAAFDMSAINLDLASDDAAREAPTTVGSGASDSSFEEEEDTLVNPGFSMEVTDTGVDSPFGSLVDMTMAPDITSSEEVATKIDLAKAYQEMGDLEGARELLQEVVNEGDAAQREVALSLLGGIRE